MLIQGWKSRIALMAGKYTKAATGNPHAGNLPETYMIETCNIH